MLALATNGAGGTGRSHCILRKSSIRICTLFRFCMPSISDDLLLLFGPYPETWPSFTPKDKLADWFEGYAKAHDMVLWTSAPLLSDPRPVYSDVDQT